MDFNFIPLGLLLAGISLGAVALNMILGGAFPQQAEQAKRALPTILIGVVLLYVSASIVSAMSQ
jgi:hypothetical protein